MYFKNRHSQLRFTDFQQPIGLKMNPENRWIKKAEAKPWAEIEERYAELFPSEKGNPAKPLRLALAQFVPYLITLSNLYKRFPDIMRSQHRILLWTLR